MRRDLRRARRAGFTLIELLVVIAILALLAALIAAGIGKVREGEQSRVTNQTLTKLQLAINNQWKTICDKCRDEKNTYTTPNKHPEFAKLVAICDGDVSRAESLWMFMNLRRNMPESFEEARNDVTVWNATKTDFVTLRKSAAFKEIQNSTVTGQPEEESAALLYIILGQGGRGNTFSIDDAMQGAQTQLTFGGLSLSAFKDGFGNYVAFRRFYQSAELNSGEYGRTRDAKMLQKGVDPMDDPLDDRGKLKLWPNAKAKDYAEKAVFNQATVPPQTFDGRNRIATAISAGVDSRDQTEGQKHQAFRSPNENDNAFGYRVGRQGTKGD